MEGHLSPFDWGVRDVRGVKKQRRCLEKITNLIDRYEPDILIIRDMPSTRNRRTTRTIRLNGLVAELARQRGIPVYGYSRADIYAAFINLAF